MHKLRYWIRIVEAGYPPKRLNYEQILQTQRELEGLRAAMRDPQTGKIYIGSSHQAAINRVPPDDASGAWGRLSDAWYHATEDTGFVNRAGDFISRSEAERRWGVLTIEDVRDELKRKK